MKRRFGPSLYFASDKVMFDSLNQRQVSLPLVRKLLEERGIFVSLKTTKEELAQYFSRLTSDYFDHKSIAEKLGKISRRERITYSEISNIPSQGAIIKACNYVKALLENEGNTAAIEVDGERVLLRVDYQHIDYSEIELRQVQERDGVIEFSLEPSGAYTLRSTQNNFLDAVVDTLLGDLDVGLSTPLSRNRISLEAHADHKVRTKFFETLVKDIEGYVYVTMTEAFCYKAKPKSIDDNDDDSAIDVEDQPFVEKVNLRGGNVDRSFVVSDLLKKEYYLVKVVWHVKLSNQIDGDHFELEAQFSSPDSCTDFSYQIRSVHLVEEGVVTQTKRSPKRDEYDSLYRLLEAAANRAYKSMGA